MDNPELADLLAEHRRPSGAPLTAAAAQGLDVIEEGLAWRYEADVEEAKANAAAESRLRKAGR